VQPVPDRRDRAAHLRPQDRAAGRAIRRGEKWRARKPGGGVSFTLPWRAGESHMDQNRKFPRVCGCDSRKTPKIVLHSILFRSVSDSPTCLPRRALGPALRTETTGKQPYAIALPWRGRVGSERTRAAGVG